MSQVSPPFRTQARTQHHLSPQKKVDLSTSSEDANGDPEGGFPLKEIDPTQATDEVAAAFHKISFPQIVSGIWHFCTVDYGSKCK